MDYSEFQVNISDFDKPKLDGVSGILRVMNDEEFLRTSIESSVSFLDELIIVYNETSIKSIEIIQEMKSRYPEKIKVYKYLPKLYIGELTEKDYLYAKSLPENSVHLLANYCNFALSKCNFRYVMKIDSDQIYFSNRMKLLTSRYRKKKTSKFEYKFVDFISFFIYVLCMFCVLKLHFFNAEKFDVLFKRLYYGYFKGLLFFIEKFKIPVSLSSVNLFLPEKSRSTIYIPLGKPTKKSIYVPLPFNGVGDTAIFKLSSKTHFVPFESPGYNFANARRYSIIERLQNVSRLLPVGVCWAHFSANRETSIYKLQAELKSCPENFTALKTTSLNSLNLFRYSNSWERYQANYYRIILPSLDNKFLVWLSNFFIANNEIRHTKI